MRSAALGQWLEDRLHLSSLLACLLNGQVERRGAWLRTTGMACFVLLFVVCFSGVILAFYYTPAPGAAYGNITAIDQNPMGRFLRALHHWGSSALILLSGLTVVRMFFAGEYRGRRDILWILVILFVQILLFFQVTGHLLPWDTNAVGTAGVEAGIAGNVWIIGPYLKKLILGSDVVGSATLTRWYGAHMLLAPLLLLLCVGLPLALYRLRLANHSSGDTTPGQPDSPLPPTDPYYPVHMAREMMVALAVFLVVAGMAIFIRTPLEAEATTANLAGYMARPEWYILPLHALITLPPFNRATLEPIATVLIPGALVTALILLPFLDRNPSRRLRERPVAFVCGTAVLLGALLLSGYAIVREGGEGRRTAPVGAVRMQEPGPPAATSAPLDANLASLGKKVFQASGCSGCHSIAGAGGKTAPDLSRVGARRPDRDWQIAHLTDPKSRVPGSTMPSFKHLKPEELRALAEYLVSLK